MQAGRVAVGGVAWAQHRGIDRVEVRVDDGPGTQARLADVDSIDTWRQWVCDWDRRPAATTPSRSAPTDGTGTIHRRRRGPNPFPDGASGWHSIVVTVA